MFEPSEGYYLAFSGGKDSVVLYDLAVRSGVKFDAHYNICPDPPELINFIRNNYPSVQRHLPELNIWKLVKQRGLPTRINRHCCAYLKECGGHNRRVLTGIRSEESKKRSGRNLVEICYKDHTKTYVNPIIDWTEKDIWEFIKKENIPHCNLYDNGWKRLGCIVCPMQSKKNFKRAMNQYPKYFEAMRRATHRYWIEHRKREPNSKWVDSLDIWEWWIFDRSKQNIDQSTMFE